MTYTVGQQLPNGATVTAFDVDTRPDGFVVETMADSAGNRSVSGTPSAAATNDNAIRQDARAALALNRAYVALDAPTAARTMAQTKAHARQINGIIRLLLNELEGTD